jgi:hypothetical protein
MSDVVGFALAFIKGLYYRDLLLDAEPEVDRRNFYLARDVRVLPPVGRLGGYHSRFIAWFDRLNDLVHFPPVVEFTKPGDNNARPYYLSVAEARERLGVTGHSSAEVMLRAFEKLGYAVQASLAYTKAIKTEVYSGEVYALERVMLEFEPKDTKDLGKVKEAVLKALDMFGSYVSDPIVIFSGNKSFYIVLELPKPIKAGEYDIRDRLDVVVRKVTLSEIHRAFYNLVVRKYLRNDQEIVRWLDNQVAEPKRLLRIPGFVHEVTGQPTQLLDIDLRPIDLDISIMEKAVLTKEVLTDVWPFIYKMDMPRIGKRTVDTGPSGPKWNCLPAWVKELINYLVETGELCHDGRLAVASWMVKCGFTDDEIHDVFKHAHNYNASRTQAKLNGIRKHVDEGKPIVGCRTVAESCKGHKAPGINCGALRTSKTRLESKPAADTTAVKPEPSPSTEAQPADPKPKEKPEPKPETKPETKPEVKPEEGREMAPSTRRPIQTRLARFVERPRGEEKAEAKPSEEVKQAEKPRDEHLVVIDIPTALIEDVARELRAPTTIAETLVNWVVDYLNRPCCWSVGFERLVIDLSRASDEEVQFALETLGIEVKERKVTDDGFAKLRSVLLTIVKYLEKAGFVEYVRDLGVVNLVRGGGDA